MTMSLKHALSIASTSRYKDQPSYVLETDLLRAEFVRHGGRMVSLRHKPRAFEFLYQQHGGTYVKAEYGKPLISAQSAGFDEMFPTIDECFCDEHPWKGTVLPDHGEAWSLDWDIITTAHELFASYYGVRLPYRFTRRAVFESSSVLHFDYRLENLSPFPFSYIWSAHPMLVAPAGARIAFPPDCCHALTVASSSGRLGAYGDTIAWPIHPDSTGTQHDLSLVRDRTVHDHEKYFFANRLTVGWCSVTYPAPQLTLRFAFPADRLPYAAVVLGEGWMHHRDSFLLLEPCTAPFDRIDLSKRYTPSSRISPHQTISWSLSLCINESTPT
jgi:galactose mutarotase-like enzyme